MFNNKKQETPLQLADLQSGTQYALPVAIIGSTVANIAKAINNNLRAYPTHKVIALTYVDKMGAVVVFEVK